MPRWEANAEGRLHHAAMELFDERGFEHTTVAEIAERAGLTRRTFFRYFADKREVLFSGEDELYELLVIAVAGAADSVTPLDTFAAALTPALAVFYHNRSRRQARQRQAVISANDALQERELIKLFRFTEGLAQTLRDRGVTEPRASATAQAATAVFRIAIERWLGDTGESDLAHHVEAALDAFKSVAAPK